MVSKASQILLVLKVIEAFNAEKEALRIYKSKDVQDFIKKACARFPNYNDDLDQADAVVDWVVVAMTKTDYFDNYSEDEADDVLDQLKSMIHAGIT